MESFRFQGGAAVNAPNKSINGDRKKRVALFQTLGEKNEGNMEHRALNIIFIGVLLLGTTSCATISNNPIASEATSESYATSSSTKGTVILAVNWGRKWACGPFENAEILSFGFDRYPLSNVTNNYTPEIFIDGPPRLLKKPIFISYALLLEPGQYALTSFDIKAARSVSDVGVFKANRTHLIVNNEIKSGSFNVKANEVIYIGHFYVDCHEEAIIWRLYPEDRDSFNSYVSEVVQKYPFLGKDKIIFRLFKTKTMGLDFDLPE